MKRTPVRFNTLQTYATPMPPPSRTLGRPRLSFQGENLISQKVSIQPVCKSQLLQKSVNICFMLVKIVDKLTNLCGNRLLQNNFINTFCEMKPGAPWSPQSRPSTMFASALQGYLAHEKPPPPLATSNQTGTIYPVSALH